MSAARLAAVVIGLLGVGCLLTAAYLGVPLIFSRSVPNPPPQQTITASISIEGFGDFSIAPDPSTGPIVAERHRERIFRSTIIDITYKTPADVNETANIQASLRVQLHHMRLIGSPGHEQPDYTAPVLESDYSDADKLPFAVTLRLEAVGLDWTQQDIPVKKDTPLAVQVNWAPRAKAPGEYTLRFPLRDINHAAETEGFGRTTDRVDVTINGKKEERGGSDDVTLPLSVTQWGRSARTIDWFKLGWTVLLGLFGAGFLWKALEKLIKHKS